MEATRVRLRVSPGARRNGIVGRHGERDKIVALAGVDAGEVDDRLAAAAQR